MRKKAIKMSKQKGEKGYHRKDARDEVWKEIKDYVKEKKGESIKDGRNFLS